MEPSGVRKIAIVGAECTGKSSLAEALAAHYQCHWVPEYAREYLGKLNLPYTALDVETIARGQLSLEDHYAAQSTDLLFCDTNLWVIKVWMDNSYKATPEWIENEIAQRPYHLHIITDPHIPYETDPLREHPEDRPYFTHQYINLLEKHNVPYLYVKGSLQERVEQATAWLK